MAGKANPDRCTKNVIRNVLENTRQPVLSGLIRSLSNAYITDGVTHLGFAHAFHYEKIQDYAAELTRILGPVAFEHIALLGWGLSVGAHAVWDFSTSKKGGEHATTNN
nr:hypothetical protein [Anaerolineae bacterium]